MSLKEVITQIVYVYWIIVAQMFKSLIKGKSFYIDILFNGFYILSF